jgi:glutathione S-transferase
MSPDGGEHWPRVRSLNTHQKVIAGHGSPLPFLRRGSRDQLFAATGTRKLPTLKLPEGTIISHSRAILAWVDEQSEQGNARKQAA